MTTLAAIAKRCFDLVELDVIGRAVLPRRSVSCVAEPCIDALALTAFALARPLYVGVGGVVLVAARTVGFDRIRRWRGDPAPNIYSRGDRLQVAGPHTVPDPAQVVELQAIPDWPDEVRIAPTVGDHALVVDEELGVSLTVEVARPEPTIPEMRGIFRNRPALINLRPVPVLDRARRPAPSQRIAVALPAGVVPLAPTTGELRPSTTINQTDRIVMHRVTSGVMRQAVPPALPLTIVPIGGLA